MRRILGAVFAVLFVVFGSTAAHGETELTQPLFQEWDQMTLDVVIVPPVHGQISNGDGTLGGGDPNELVPIANSYVRATEKAIGDWQRAIRTFGSPALRRLRLNVYVLGRDVFSPAILSPLDILVTYGETLFPVAGGTTVGEGYVEFSGVRLGGNPRCTNVNAMFGPTNFTFADMYNIAGHEFGHCLGIGHVGPSGDPVVVSDIMHWRYEESVGARGNKLHCMSNINVAGLELAFDGKSNPSRATMPASKYKRIAC